MSIATKKFKHVSYLWDEKAAAAMAGDEVALLIYRSQSAGRRSAPDQLRRREHLL
jgi:hypothetical protein